MSDEMDIVIHKDYVTVPIERYQSLLQSEKLLQCLKNAGVDTWDGYHYAISILWKR